MLSRLWKKVLAFFGFGPDEDDEREVPAESQPGSDWQPELPRRGSLVSLPGQSRDLKVLVIEPKAFDEVQGIADQIRNRRPVILNLETMERREAEGVLHFLGGAIYALGGESRRIATGIFLFAPPGIDITSLSKSSLGSVGGADLSQGWSGQEVSVAGSDRLAAGRDPLRR